jgi:hypothetical protein
MLLKNGWCGEIKYAEGMIERETQQKEKRAFCPCSCVCSHCGKEIKTSSKFCSECGYRIG